MSIILTLFGTAQLRMNFVIQSYGGGFKYGWMTFNFFVTGEQAPGYTADDFTNSAFVSLYEIFGEQFNNQWPVVSQYWTINDKIPARQASGVMEFGSSSVAAPQAFPQSCCIHQLTAEGGRRGTGRIMWPMVLPGDTTGSAINFNFNTRLDPVLQMMRFGFSVDGWDFLPCVWSRLNNACYPVTGLKLATNVGWTHKRKLKSSIIRYPIDWPTVW